MKAPACQGRGAHARRGGAAVPPAGAGSLGPPPGGPPAQPRPGWLLQSGGVATPAVQGGCAVNTQDSPGTRSSVFGPLPVLLRFLIPGPSFRKEPPSPRQGLTNFQSSLVVSSWLPSTLTPRLLSSTLVPPTLDLPGDTAPRWQGIQTGNQ